MIWTWNVLGLHNFVQAAYEPIMVRPMYEKTNRHVNATKSYLHFDRFVREAIFCSNFFGFSLFLDVLFLS